MPIPSLPNTGEVSRLIGEKIFAVRRARRMTQEELSELAGMSRNQIQNIEHNRNNTKDSHGRRGSANSRIETIFSIAYALEVDPMYLINPELPVEPVPARSTPR